MKSLLNRKAAVLVVVLGGIILLLAALVLFISDKHHAAQAQLDALEPRFARALGLRAASADLTKAEREAQGILEQFAYSSTQDTSQTGNDAQQRVRTLFSTAGLDVASSQVLPAKDKDKEGKFFDRINLVVQLEGELVALQSALVLLSNQKPFIFVEGFNIQTIGVVKAEIPQKLSIKFNIFVLRVLP